MLRSETENPDGVLETFLTMLDPHGPGNPSRMVVHVSCQKLGMGGFSYENKLVLALRCSWSTLW